MNKEIHFSIVVPTYNRPRLLQRSLKNILASEYQSFEVIVINDGGSEESEQVVKNLNSSKIRYYWKINEQKGVAKNFGIAKAKGEYILSFDDDDLMYPQFLSIANKKIKENNFPELYYQGYEIVDLTGNFVNYPKDIDLSMLDIFAGNPFSNNGMFLKREICKMPLYLPRKDFTLSADWLLWIKLLSQHKCVINNVVTHGVSVHPERGSASANVAQYENNLYIFEFELKTNKWGTAIQRKKAIAYYHTYVALFLTLGGEKSKGIKYLIKGILMSPRELFSRRFLAIIKHLLLPIKH